jgi:hypothetical protein
VNACVVELSDIVRYLTEMGIPEMSKTERGALPRVLRAAVMEDDLHRRRVDRLTVLVAVSTIANFLLGVWIAVLHR